MPSPEFLATDCACARCGWVVDYGCACPNPTFPLVPYVESRAAHYDRETNTLHLPANAGPPLSAKDTTGVSDKGPGTENKDQRP